MQGFLSVSEGPPLDYLAATHRIDIGQLHILPLIAALGSKSGVHKYDDPAASSSEHSVS
jgi:hypothetical protein